MAFLDETGVSTLWGLIDEKFTRFTTGTYTGTGTSGSENPNSLTFPFVPKVVIIRPENAGGYNLIAINGMTKTNTVYSDNQGRSVNTLTWSGQSLSWYNSYPSGSPEAGYQLNVSGTTYHYIVLG